MEEEAFNIQIGENVWIKWVDVPGRDTPEFNADELLKPILPFIQGMEAYCVAGCCGMDAFSFLPDDVQKAIKTANVEDLKPKLEWIRREVEKRPELLVSCTDFNSTFEKGVFLKLLDHFIDMIL